MKPLFDIKPNFISEKTMLECVCAAFGAFLTFGMYPVIFIFVPMEGQTIQPSVTLMIILSVVLTVLPAIGYYYWRKLTYAKTRYQFFADRVVYQESFLNAEEKEFSYERIAETSLKRNIIQQYFDVGTVTLMTYATGGAYHSSGLKLRDLECPQDAYKRIKAIIEDSKKSENAA